MGENVKYVVDRRACCRSVTLLIFVKAEHYCFSLVHMRNDELVRSSLKSTNYKLNERPFQGGFSNVCFVIVKTGLQEL